MANCSRCGAELKPGAKFCDVCGAPADLAADVSAAADASAAAGTSAAPDASAAAGAAAQDFGQQAQNTYQQTQNTYQQAQNTYQQPQNTYQQPQMQYGQQAPQPVSHAGEIPTVGSWMLTLFLMCIPIVNIVMLFVWGFSSDTPDAKKNWARARLIWMAIGIVLSILIMVVFGAAFVTLVSHQTHYEPSMFLPFI